MAGRVWFERLLRLTGLGALAVALVLAALGTSDDAMVRTIRSADLPAVLARAAHHRDSLIVVTDTALDPVHRDWLAAERASGRGVRWGGTPVPPVAVSVEPLADPAGGARVLVASAAGAKVRITDSLGVLDSAVALGGGTTLTVPRLVGGAHGTSGGQTAQGHLADSLVVRRIVVFGSPSWETKFVIAALEERGWQVDARMPLSPDTAVMQGASGRLDTARVAAVVALDASAARAARSIEAFVRQGGGVVLGPAAAADPAFARLRAGMVGARQPAPMIEIRAGDPRRALPLVAIGRLVEGGVALERRDGAVAVAARRLAAGRVVQLGYDETWRWRMSGPDGSVEAHRAWWSSVAGSVAYRATVGLPPAVSPHDAPLARMVARLGPSDSILTTDVVSGRGGAPRRPAWWLFGLGLAALVAEWGSRRLRGAA